MINNAKINITSESDLVQRNEDYKFSFDISSPMVIGSETAVIPMESSNIGTNQMFKATVDLSSWQSISKLEVI